MQSGFEAYRPAYDPVRHVLIPVPYITTSISMSANSISPPRRHLGLDGLPTELLLEIMTFISPFVRARTLSRVNRRLHQIEERLWIRRGPSCLLGRIHSKEDFVRRYLLLQPWLQRALKVNESFLTLHAIFIPSSYVALSQKLLTKALEVDEQDNEILEGICRAMASVCSSTDLREMANKLSNAAKTGPKTRELLIAHMGDAVKNIVEVESIQPTLNISDPTLTIHMFREKQGAICALREVVGHGVSR